MTKPKPIGRPKLGVEPTNAEFILRVRVRIASADRVQQMLKSIAESCIRNNIPVSLSRIERADYKTHSIHVKREKVI